jgi:hypothetical protein
MDASRSTALKKSNSRKGIPNKVHRAEVQKLIDERGDMRKVVDGLFQLSLGVYAEEVIDGQRVRVYQEKPDKGAAQILLEHRHGKPTQRTELSQLGDKPFAVALIPMQKKD